MSPREVAVTGVGLLTPVGVGREASWQGMLAGRSPAASDPVLAGLPVDFSCRLPDFDISGQLGKGLKWRLDPFTAMAILAAREAVADAGLETDDWEASRVGVVIGAGSASMARYDMEYARLGAGRVSEISPLAITRSVPNMVAGEVGLALGARGPNFSVSTACASGASALGIARDLVRAGTCDVVVAGGSESVRARMAAACFFRMGALSRRSSDPAAACRPFEKDRDGFVLSEGAGMLVLERIEHARARRARPRAYLGGYGASCDAHHYAAPHPTGDGAASAIRAALRDAGLAPADIQHINAHGTATRLNDKAEYEALRQVFSRPPAVTSLKGTIGHCMGGAGAIEAACTVLSLEHQQIPPTANLDHQDPEIDLDIVSKAPRPAPMRAALSNSFGFGGQNAVLLFHNG
ncbi:3-oxoacyl-[acyl-carrier-protein] synthase II [Streptomyces sp. DvalAA-14]|uniref:beta-ketoacyl-[acyl-carrier-protein] synthase family protein n=1 Tax=unclassified Streptomyces TaxID=2593676 RepID=UPI00081B3B53|nr:MULTISPECIES: beta-ketoacyl-[acyl-carrier-protein] synthase family protein [unclassified Streptomyces]MYS21832.1 beta-ketoacyl-ACP synthase II [Streptomyces sp. SID4948]SCE02026.1 3-oxoacyl-[acyl-carrier-protein] synthase II [Streptomyces sp. DvalAA-14]